jgi:putative copper export protein
VYTIENLFHFLHQLAAIIWVGGILAVNALQVRIGRGNNRAAQASLLRQSDLYGRAVIAPAAAVVLLTGLVLVVEDDIPLSEFWVAWGLTAIFLSLALGATLIRATNAELRRLAAAVTLDNPRWPALQRRAATLYAVNLLLLLSVVWAMVFKPTL